MSTEDYVLDAEAREDAGKGASRRLRRLAEKVPAIVYGGKKKPQSISIAHNKLSKQLESDAIYSHIITLNIDGKSEEVILKDLQRHPAKAQILHADFLRVSKTKKFHTRVPLRFINAETCKGVKLQGGSVSHNMSELEISCLPANLPEHIDVDLIDVEIGQIVHISDITLPEGVESVALAHGEGHDLPVATINKPKAESEEVSDSPEEQGEQPEEGADE